MEKIWVKNHHFVRMVMPEDSDAKTTVKELLDRICSDLGLAWKLDAQGSGVTIDYLWRTPDPRPAAELLQYVWKPPYYTEFEKDTKWQHAFNALVSTEANLARASLVRQRSVLESWMRSLKYPEGFALKPILVSPAVDTKGEKHVVIVMNHPIFTSPGHGSVSYYWFKDDGTLRGAGLIDSGHRCRLVDVILDRENPPPGEASEMQMVLKFNLNTLFIARLVLEPGGLKLISLTDAKGHPQDNDGIHVGRSLLPGLE